MDRLVGKKNTLYYLILTILSKVFTYLLLFVLGNMYVVRSYGKASFVLSVFQIVGFFCTIGVPQILVPWIIRKKDVSSVFYFLSIINILAVTFGIFLSFRYPLILPLIIIIPLALLSNIGYSFLRTEHKYHIVQLFGTATMLLYFLFAMIFIRLGALGIVLAHIGAYTVPGFVVIFMTRKSLIDVISKIRIKKKVVYDYTKKGLVISLVSVSFLFLNWIDSSLLGLLSTFENVAKYNIAGPISNVITLIPISLSMFLLTRSAEEKVKKYSEGMFHRTLRLSFSFSLILAILINSFLFLIIKILFRKYIGIEALVMILSIGILFYAVYNLMYTYLAGKLTPEKAFWPIVLAALLNILLDIILIPQFGLYGIVFATMIAHSVAFSLLALKMNLLKKYCLIYILVLFIPLSFYMGYFGLLTLIIAVPGLFLAKLIEKDDLMVVKETIRNIVK